MDPKPRKVKAKITRVVTEIATIILASDGTVDEYEECYEEIDSEVTDVLEIITILSVHG